MFDIIGSIREKIFRRPSLTPKTLAGEELSEKQTTKMGYFLLYCMFFAILATGQWSLSIIKDIPTQPQNVPYCVEELTNYLSLDASGLYYENAYGYCILASEYPKFDFTEEYNQLKPIALQVSTLRSQLENYNSQKYKNADYQQSIQNDYNTSLTEKIAWENSGIYDSQDIQANLQNQKEALENIEANIQSTQSQINTIINANSKEVEILKGKIQVAKDEYDSAYLVYRLIVAILSFTFALLVFFTLYHFYVKTKTQNSPNTVIFSVAAFAYWLIVLQVFLLFLWDIIPHEILNIIFKFLKNLTFIVYILQFLWPLIIVGVFWFLVYKIQKRLYSPQNILKRFISDKKCPNCGNSVDFTKPFCPLCSHEIQIHCKECKTFTVKGMPFCSSCGKKPE